MKAVKNKIPANTAAKSGLTTNQMAAAIIPRHENNLMATITVILFNSFIYAKQYGENLTNSQFIEIESGQP